MVDPSDKIHIQRFLNRLMILPIERQNGVFARFFENFKGHIAAAQQSGVFDSGVTDLADALHVALVESKNVQTTDAEAKTVLHRLAVTRRNVRFTVRDAETWRNHHLALNPERGAALAGWYRNRRSNAVFMLGPSGTVSDPATGNWWRRYLGLRPNGTTVPIDPPDMERYERLDDALAVAGWNEQLKNLPETRTDDVIVVRSHPRSLAASGTCRSPRPARAARQGHGRPAGRWRRAASATSP